MSDYMPLNYKQQSNTKGDDAWVIGGTITVSGTSTISGTQSITGTQDIAAAGILSFYSEEFTGTELQAIGRKTQPLLWTNLSTGSTVLSDAGGSSPPVIPSGYGAIWLSVTGTMTNGSARMFSAKVGQHLFINLPLLGGSTASVIVYCSGHASGIAGAVVLGSTGSHCSSFSLRQSAASGAWVHFYGVGDGTSAYWAVLEYQGTFTERMA